MEKYKYKVKDLIDILKQQNPETEIWCASDEEGNSFHPKINIELTMLGEEENLKPALVFYPLTSNEDIY